MVLGLARSIQGTIKHVILQFNPTSLERINENLQGLIRVGQN
jgi:hypothetical protein